jgi:lysophospholipase L1-like esterase
VGCNDKQQGHRPIPPQRFQTMMRAVSGIVIGFASLNLHSVEPLKVACVGDSITEGAGVTSPSLESYPARLQRLLGTNFVVRNFGVSGRTLLKKGDFPYWSESAYDQSLAWGPDIVLIKLGSNDSKPQNWRYGTNFVNELEELIRSYRPAGADSPQVILCTPAPVYRAGAFGINPGIVATNIAPGVRTLAARLGLRVIDFHTRLADHPEWFPDTIHPNTRGMAVMAAVVFEHLAIPTPPPGVQIETATNRRVVMRWPSHHGDWVLQFRTRLDPPGPGWAVADQVPYSDGTTIRLTNTVSASRFFRLWKP